jgi:hypothetical protein
MEPCVFVPRATIDESLAMPAVPGKRMLQPFFDFAVANKLPFKILEDREVSNEAEIHVTEGDLWLCLEGEVTFICGGEMVNPKMRQAPDGTPNENEWYAEAISGGRESAMKAGDWLWIPPGQPHQHVCKTQARLVIIKLPKLN